MIHRITRFVFSTKQEFINYLKSFWINIFLSDWCFHCEYRLEPKEKTFCSHCLDFVFDEIKAEQECTLLAPKGSILEKLLLKPKPEIKQNKLMEALFLKILLEKKVTHQKQIFYLDKNFKAFKTLKKNFQLIPFTHHTYWKNQDMIVLTIDLAYKEWIFNYAKYSKVASLKVMAIHR
jgi:hypothetical protein